VMAGDAPAVLDGLVAVPTFRGSPSTSAADISGLDPYGNPVEITVVGSGHRTLVLFLSSTCQGCAPAWGVLNDPESCGLATDDVIVAVTRQAPQEDAAAVGRLSLPGARVVMSDAAWRAYRVQGAPFFALVGGDGRRHSGTRLPHPVGDLGPKVMTEGVVWGIAQLAADVCRAIRPEPRPEPNGPPSGSTCRATRSGPPFEVRSS